MRQEGNWQVGRDRCSSPSSLHSLPSHITFSAVGKVHRQKHGSNEKGGRKGK